MDKVIIIAIIAAAAVVVIGGGLIYAYVKSRGKSSSKTTQSDDLTGNSETPKPSTSQGTNPSPAVQKPVEVKNTPPNPPATPATPPNPSATPVTPPNPPALPLEEIKQRQVTNDPNQPQNVVREALKEETRLNREIRLSFGLLRLFCDEESKLDGLSEAEKMNLMEKLNQIKKIINPKLDDIKTVFDTNTGSYIYSWYEWAADGVKSIYNRWFGSSTPAAEVKPTVANNTASATEGKSPNAAADNVNKGPSTSVTDTTENSKKTAEEKKNE